MKNILILLYIFLSISLFAQKPDTTFLFQKPGQKVFIEPTKNIEQYQRLIDFELDDTLSFFRESLETFKQRGLKYHKYNFGNFPKQ